MALALGAEGRRRLGEMLDGIEAYRAHPYRRRLPKPPVIWSEGSSKLYAYGDGAGRKRRGVLFVPSLINRGYLLDLSERGSLLRALSRRGFSPFLVEWGAPGPAERAFTLTDYISGRLERALEAAADAAGGPVAVVGYCMGGLMALALCLSRPDAVASLALLATPWDFHAERADEARRLALFAGSLEVVLKSLGELPVDVIQALFASLDPLLVAAKFRGFAGLDPESEAAENFVALEDWLNDGVPLSASVARECLSGWYGENRPGRGLWRIAGRMVRPEELSLPALVMCPRRDRIVPPGSAAALARAIPGARRITVPLGHIGMVVSARAPKIAWEPLAEWLGAKADTGSRRRGASSRRGQTGDA